MNWDYLNTPVLLRPGISDDVALGFVEELQKDLVSLGFGYILPDGVFGHSHSTSREAGPKDGGVAPRWVRRTRHKEGPDASEACQATRLIK